MGPQAGSEEMVSSLRARRNGDETIGIVHSAFIAKCPNGRETEGRARLLRAGRTAISRAIYR